MKLGINILPCKFLQKYQNRYLVHVKFLMMSPVIGIMFIKNKAYCIDIIT